MTVEAMSSMKFLGTKRETGAATRATAISAESLEVNFGGLVAIASVTLTFVGVKCSVLSVRTERVKRRWSIA
jgi:hypothetical protein